MPHAIRNERSEPRPSGGQQSSDRQRRDSQGNLIPSSSQQRSNPDGDRNDRQPNIPYRALRPNRNRRRNSQQGTTVIGTPRFFTPQRPGPTARNLNTSGSTSTNERDAWVPANGAQESRDRRHPNLDADGYPLYTDEPSDAEPENRDWNANPMNGSPNNGPASYSYTMIGERPSAADNGGIQEPEDIASYIQVNDNLTLPVQTWLDDRTPLSQVAPDPEWGNGFYGDSTTINPFSSPDEAAWLAPPGWFYNPSTRQFEQDPNSQ